MLAGSVAWGHGSVRFHSQRRGPQSQPAEGPLRPPSRAASSRNGERYLVVPGSNSSERVGDIIPDSVGGFVRNQQLHEPKPNRSAGYREIIGRNALRREMML